MSDKRNRSRSVRCGLSPVCDAVLKHKEKKPSSSISQSKLDKLEKIATSLRSTNESIDSFLDSYPSWANERLVCIIEINELANNITFHHRNISIAQLPTSVAGIGAGILTITGLALIPVTFGVSLGLTISGAAIGAGVTVTGMATSATDYGIQKNCKKKAEVCIEGHKSSTEEFFKLGLKLADDFGEVEEMSALKDCEMQLVGEAIKLSTLGVKNAANALARTVPKASKALYLLNKGFGLVAS